MKITAKMLQEKCDIANHVAPSPHGRWVVYSAYDAVDIRFDLNDGGQSSGDSPGLGTNRQAYAFLQGIIAGARMARPDWRF